jgi:hypothetical protein
MCALVLEKVRRGEVCSWCHSLTVQSALQLTKRSLTNGDHLTLYTAP